MQDIEAGVGRLMRRTRGGAVHSAHHGAPVMQTDVGELGLGVVELGGDGAFRWRLVKEILPDGKRSEEY